MTRTGAVLDGAGILVASTTAAAQPRVVFDGDAYLVAWAGSDGVHSQRIGAGTGALLGAGNTLYVGCARNVDLGRDAVGVLLVIEDCTAQLLAQRAGVAGAVGGPVTISPPMVPTARPRIAWNGSEWLVAFEELIAVPSLGPVFLDRGNVYTERLSITLAALDPQPIAIAVSKSNESTPLVASDGRDFFVAWSRLYADEHGHPAGVYARVVSADGTAGEATQLVNGPAEGRSVVWDGMRYAVAYAIDRGDFTHELYLTHGGDRIPISAAWPEQRDVALAAAGGTLRAAYARVAIEPAYGGVFRVFVREIAGRRRVAGR